MPAAVPALTARIHAPGARHSQMRVDGEPALEADHQMLAARIDRPHALARQLLDPAVSAEARMRCLERFDLAADERRAYAVGCRADRVALRHQADSVSFRGLWRKPSSIKTGSIAEPTTGSPSKRSTASWRMRPLRTCSASASSAVCSSSSLGSDSGTRLRPFFSANRTGSPPTVTRCAPGTRAGPRPVYSRLGHGSDAPYGFAGSVTAITSA